ncbi:hypothetical protein CNMCM5793_003713 [Aspergillus hiratsukae]|uniref:Uncharacterized protein n=1 Tax=Aspergillus hiratsukae TaxID=1194566 RepID=A0A8H6UID5_9EURO|nr:hypothetical protein CNMCM5793_003713 [Aspergillus hiratsukae]KAF7168540.1 hypothetical protein CNMCM6106_003678 [Aspergillus hiratsukae]
MMSSIPNIPPHSLECVGKTEPIKLDDLLNSIGIDFCDGHLEPRLRSSEDKSVNVVYVVGTANKDKLKNMDIDMQAKLDSVRNIINDNKLEASINFLGTYGLEVSSGQPPQPVGFEEGIRGAAGKTGRIGNGYLAIQRLLRQEEQGLKIPEGLEDAIKNADVHIFGGQEASADLQAKQPYEPNYIAYYLATESPLELSQRYSMAKTPGLQVVVEAVKEAIKRNVNKYEGRDDWTGGKVLVDWGLATKDSDWHWELGPKGTNRFTWVNMGYKGLRLPIQWFEQAVPQLASMPGLLENNCEALLKAINCMALLRLVDHKSGGPFMRLLDSHLEDEEAEEVTSKMYNLIRPFYPLEEPEYTHHRKALEEGLEYKATGRERGPDESDEMYLDRMGRFNSWPARSTAAEAKWTWRAQVVIRAMKLVHETITEVSGEGIVPFRPEDFYLYSWICLREGEGLRAWDYGRRYPPSPPEELPIAKKAEWYYSAAERDQGRILAQWHAGKELQHISGQMTLDNLLPREKILAVWKRVPEGWRHPVQVPEQGA